MERRTGRAGCLLRAMAVAAAAVFSFVSLVPGAVAGPKGTDRPMKGGCEMAIEVLEPLNPPHPMVLALDVRCHLSHLGLTYGGTARELIYATAPPTPEGFLPMAIYIERITYIAANGDELWSTYSGSGEINLATHWGTFDGWETYTGGTGRFDGATGASRLVGAGSPYEGVGHFTTKGTISY